MDFTPEFNAFQGALLTADNVHSFSRLTARGGNEDQIDYIIENLRRCLEQQGYISQNVLVQDKIAKMQKLAFYIIMNADLPALETLVENDEISSVIWTVPTIPKCLMSEMLWKLQMGKFIYEAIAFSCPQLSLEVASALLDYLKYFSPSESLQKLLIITSAIYKQICRFHFFSHENDILTNLLTLAMNNFQKCLNYFIEPPKAHKLLTMKRDDLYRFQGHSLQAMLDLINKCLTEYTSVQTFNPPDFSEIYQLTYKVGSYKEDALNFATCNSPNKSILECLDKCNEMLLDTCKALVMDISVDIFCAWTEFEEDGKSMQQTIGETCYKLRTKLLNISVVSEHPVVNMIQQISRKPVEILEIIDITSTDVIVKNIQQNNEKRPEWVRALICKDKVFEDNVLVDLLASNLDVLNEKECQNLYKLSNTYLNNHLANAENVKTLAIKVFQKCTLETKIEILDDHFKDNVFSNTMETLDCNAMMTEIFNKVIADVNVDLTDILTIFLQNPQHVYTKIFNLSAESSQASNIMLQVMKLLEKYSNHYYVQDTEPCLIRIAETVLEGCLDKETTQQNFIKFVCGLKTANIIPGTKLLILIIMPKLHKALLDKDICRIHFQCKLLSEAFILEELMAYRAPMLAMIAQVLEVVRWKITTFVEEGPSALQLALELQKKLMDTYEGVIPEKEENWLKSKLKKLHPLNCYYYRKLWNPPGRNFVEIVSGTTVSPDMDAELLQSWLSQILSSTTQEEWCQIWDSLTDFTDTHKLTSILNILIVLTVTEAANRSETNSWQCVLQCYRNFIFIVRYKFFKEPLTDDQVTEFVKKISIMANIIDEEVSAAVASVFLPLFVYVVTRKSDYTVDISRLMNDLVRNNVFKDTVSKVYSNGAT